MMIEREPVSSHLCRYVQMSTGLDVSFFLRDDGRVDAVKGGKIIETKVGSVGLHSTPLTALPNSLPLATSLILEFEVPFRSNVGSKGRAARVGC